MHMPRCTTAPSRSYKLKTQHVQRVTSCYAFCQVISLSLTHTRAHTPHTRTHAITHTHTPTHIRPTFGFAHRNPSSCARRRHAPVRASSPADPHKVASFTVRFPLLLSLSRLSLTDAQAKVRCRQSAYSRDASARIFEILKSREW